jgi:hypothetical protein
LSAGYVFGDSDRILLEPSLLFQLVENQKKKSIDINIKALTKYGLRKSLGALSYRRSFDGANILMETGFQTKLTIHHSIVG